MSRPDSHRRNSTAPCRSRERDPFAIFRPRFDESFDSNAIEAHRTERSVPGFLTLVGSECLTEAGSAASDSHTAGWTERDLQLRPKSDKVKITLAAQLRRETTMTLKWIAKRVQIGAWTHLNKRLYDLHRKNQS